MLQVSTFELLIKPIAPRKLLPVNLQGVARRVVQGYFLTISNLEDKDLVFKLDFFDSKPNPSNPNRELSLYPRNFDLLFDIAGKNEALIGTSLIGANPISGSFTLPARQTASVELLPALAPFIPNPFGNPPTPTPLPSPLNDPNPDLEIRGFVQLSLPAIFTVTLNPVTITSKPQSKVPVKVLLQPEIRGTFLPNDFPSNSTGDFDPINYSLVTGSGKALNEVEPEGLNARNINPILVDSVIKRLEAEGVNLENLKTDEVTRIKEIVEFFAQIDPDSESLENFSDLLSKVNIPIKLNRV